MSEGRVCALNGPQGMIGYQYDANGNRVGKGTVTNWQSCDITANGYVPTTDFVLDQSGGQMTELAVYTTSAGTQYQHVHSNVSAGGALIASLDSLYNPHFYLTDALGSRRVQTDAAGIPEQTCQSLPFGDQLLCTGGSLATPTEHHFTGKERDTESGLDYFGARYYNSSMGRFSSPDDGSGQNALSPQSWNLYSYVQNNPLSNTDSDGHDCVYINNDTGAFESWNPGDCDNSTDAKANTGHYFDGSLSTIYTTTGDASGQVTGWQGTSDVTGANTFVGNSVPSLGNWDNPLQASVFGPASASTWNNAAGVTNAAATPLMVFLAVAVPGILEGSLPAAGLGIGGVGAAKYAAAAADAERIASGHAFAKHASEFGNITQNEFKEAVQSTMANPSEVRVLSNGRTAYWNDSNGMVVIKNPAAADGGTAFIPTAGKAYFNNLR